MIGHELPDELDSDNMVDNPLFRQPDWQNMTRTKTKKQAEAKAEFYRSQGYEARVVPEG